MSTVYTDNFLYFPNKWRTWHGQRDTVIKINNNNNNISLMLIEIPLKKSLQNIFAGNPGYA